MQPAYDWWRFLALSSHESEVGEALPEGWDDHVVWTIVADGDEHPRSYAKTRADEEAGGETVTDYVITIYPALLDRLSDSACR